VNQGIQPCSHNIRVSLLIVRYIEVATWVSTFTPSDSEKMRQRIDAMFAYIVVRG
jgi:hypothetical protein